MFYRKEEAGVWTHKLTEPLENDRNGEEGWERNAQRSDNGPNSHLPPGSHELRGGGWGGQELQAPAQLKPPRAKASRAERAPGGSTARCIQPMSGTRDHALAEAKPPAVHSAKPAPTLPLPGQQWPQEPWRWGPAPYPSSLVQWSSSNCS